MKVDAKRKKALTHKNLRATGGGPSSIEPLDDLTESVVGMIGKVPISGDPSIPESSVCFNFDVPKM